MSHYEGLSEDSVNPDPFIQFNNWYCEHLSTGIAIPESFSLGTASEDGKVSLRTVLLKSHGADGFVFFTNYDSRKGRQLSVNHNLAMLFYWPEAGRQVRIEGVAEKVAAEYSDSYFKTRPRESQLSAWTSEQSREVADRMHLEKRYEYFKEKFSGIDVPRPRHWGGFRVIPSWFEFWKNDEFRLHDRISYTLVNNLWIIKRLAP